MEISLAKGSRDIRPLLYSLICIHLYAKSTRILQEYNPTAQNTEQIKKVKTTRHKLRAPSVHHTQQHSQVAHSALRNHQPRKKSSKN